MPLKFSKSDAIRPIAERKIDEFFAARIDEILGPIAALHARKRVMAQADMIEDKADQAAILAKAAEQDIHVQEIDALRRGYKARLRASARSGEIMAIVTEATGVGL